MTAPRLLAGLGRMLASPGRRFPAAGRLIVAAGRPLVAAGRLVPAAGRLVVAALLAWQAVSAGIVVTGPEARAFLGGRTGKIAYLKGYLTKVYFVDLADSVLTEKLLSNDEQCLSPMIHPGGTRVLYEHNSSIWIRDLVENSPTRIQVFTRPWKLGETMEPRWWIDPRDSVNYVIYHTGVIADHEWTPASGSTFMVKLDKDFKPVSTTMLLPFMMTGGRSRDGVWGATSGHSTGMYLLNASKVENAFRDATNWLPAGVLLACNPSISPSAEPARMNRMLHLHSGGQTMSGKVYENHKAILMRSWSDPDVDHPLWWIGEPGDRCENDSSGNLFWEAPEWSNDENYFTATGSKEVDIPEGQGDLYVVRMNLAGESKLLRVFRGGATDYYAHLWIKDGISPARIILDPPLLNFAAYKKDTVNPAPQTVKVRNGGDGTLPAVKVGALPGWIKVSIAENGTNTPKLHTSVLRDSLQPGEHRAKVSVTYGGGVDSAAFEVVFRFSDPVLTSLRPAAAHPAVAVGDTLRLSVTALDQAGKPMPQAPAIAWTGLGALKPDSGGLFRADSAAWRTYPVVASSGAVSCTLQVTVASRILRVDVGAAVGKAAPGWSADTVSSVGGTLGALPDSVPLAPVADGAPDQAVRTFRQGSSAYHFRGLPNGRYRIRVHLVAARPGDKGTLTFKLEGTKHLEGYALPAPADTLSVAADMREFAVSVADGNGLLLELLGVAGSPALSALEVFDIGLPPVSLLYPNGGETLRIGDTLTIRWKTDTVIASCGISLSVDSGAKWLPLTRLRSVASGDPDWENFKFVIPDSLDRLSLVSAKALISVYDYFGTDRDRSDGVFAIEGVQVSARRAPARPVIAPALLPGGRILIDLGPFPGAFDAEISDLFGRRVRSISLAGGRRHILDLGRLPASIYRLSIRGPGYSRFLLIPAWP